LPSAFANAFRLDAIGDPRDAVRAHLEVVQAASQRPEDPWQVAALEASLDALATRQMLSLGDAARNAALAYRSREAAPIADELGRAALRARGQFAKGLIARARGAIAERRGDAADAERQRAASGCAREAVVIGPIGWAPITGVREVGSLDRADARIEPSYSTGDAFGTAAHPTVVRGRGCSIELSAESARPGVRWVVVDVAVPHAQTVGLVLRTHSAALLRAGGTEVLERPYELGDEDAARFARVAATAGTLRVALRVGTAKEDDSVEIDAFDEDGAPLAAHAPATGSTSGGRILAVQVATPPQPRTDDESLLYAAAALGANDPRTAERAIWPVTSRQDFRPDLAIVYARAVETARDLSQATRAERARGAYERALEIWPKSWEAAIGHAVLAGVRRGHEEAGLETLRDLGALRAKSLAEAAPLLDAFEAMVSGREGLFDRARAALARARPALGPVDFLIDAEAAATPRVGPELAASACDLARFTAHDTLACLDALRRAGDRAGAMRELARLRAVLGAPARFLPLELREALAAGDDATARRAFAAMLPAERTMSALVLLQGAPDARSARAELRRLASTAPDAPAALAPLLRALGDDTGAEFDGLAERLAAEDRAQPAMPSAATLVLAHTERYEVSPAGLVHWLLFDVRRVSGTTDVDQNAQAAAPEIWGRGAMRAVRRRILKKDGRIVEPDRTQRASQAHADLAQLEQGDFVEALYEGYALPGDTGDIGIDTPDLLADRIAVRDSTIELRLPRSLRGALWSHEILSKPVERSGGDTRILTWRLADRAARRLEDGVPKMDRSVAVSFSTSQWASIGRALRETVAALDEHDPEIDAWARSAVAGVGKKSPRAMIDALVTNAGAAVREAEADTLSDYGGAVASVQSQTARTFLTSHEGSRAWLVLRSLRELGIACDLVVAENDPFSADPTFPPHFGRFAHPLVVAHLPPDASDSRAFAAVLPPWTDVWIDADVAGPPLPAGRVSPELRGRLALYADGAIAPLPVFGSSENERDEVDIRLALDPLGNASGTFAILLRGREAQELAEALYRIVGAERQRALRSVVLSWLPWANVDDVQLASTEGSWQVSLRAEVTVGGYAQAQGDKTWLLPGIDTLHRAWPHARVSSLAATFASRAGRQSALALSSAVQYHVHRRVELPGGAVVGRVPGPLEVRAKLIEAARTVTVGQGTIEDDFVLGVATGTISAADYTEFARVAHQADDAFLAAARVLVSAAP
jgi:tetratricopeptide (TPR) repeat protein